MGLQIFKTFLLLYDNRPQKNAFNMLCCAGRGAGGPTGRGPGTARVMPSGGKETFICVFLEIYEIPYMKKVTEFREIPRNFTESPDTEFGGIPPEF